MFRARRKPFFDSVHLLRVLAVIVLTGGISGAVDERLSFSRDVLPILSDRCFICHGPDESTRQAELRFDIDDESQAAVIVPGDVAASEFIQRVRSDDLDMRMPPPDSNLTLTAAEIGILERWIAEGAVRDQHWSFVPLPQQVSPPEVDHVEWVSNDIDRFVLAALEQEGLLPSGMATREAYLRRVSLDLTGLPPTPEDIDAFLNDVAPGAEERVVDRLLASARFGERMAADWLDIARYADTYGYQNDRYRDMWPWRDWVVRAFNENLPYDQFITWQLAGDLLPDATRDQTLATAFNRNHRQTNEGGSIEDEFRKEYVADRVNTFGAAFLGLTLECARCHDHKYDPIRQTEYYQLAAFFNSIDESGLYSHFTDAVPTPALLLPTPDQQQRIDETQRAVADAEQRRAQLRASLRAGFKPATLTDRGQPLRGLIAHYPLDDLAGGKVADTVNAEAPGKTANDPQSIPGVSGNGAQMSGDNTITVPAGGGFTRDDPFSISLWVRPSRRFDRAVILHRSRAWTDSGSQGYELLIEDGRLSAALIHFWPGNAIRIQAREELPVGEWRQVTMTYDGSSRADGLSLFVNGDRAQCDVIRDNLTKQIHADVKELAIGERFRDVGFQDSGVDELRVFDVQLTALEVADLFIADSQSPGSAPPSPLPTPAQTSPLPTPGGEGQGEGALYEYYLHSACPEYQAALAELRSLRQARSQAADPIPAIMVMQEMAEPRPTHRLNRGAYDAPAERVSRQTPAALGLMPDDASPNRLGLARWLTRPDHPLTARVTVNRFWQMMFGTGLVSTIEDFGRQGSSPTHPELLDYLARYLVDSGWDVKALLKLIALSSTYRQDSDCAADLRTRDPQNALLARGPVQRLSAEMLRDSALAASGLLVEKLGGPPVRPWQPPGLWEEKSGVAYQREEGEGSHRRSLYTYWKRTSQPPAMMTFDASNREVCVVRRQVTHTPLQVLVLMNDPQFVEAAYALAERACVSCPQATADRLLFMFRTLTGRRPDDHESAVLEQIYAEQLDEFRSGRCDAAALLTTGDHRVDASLDAVQVAALSIVAQALMNHDEFVMKR